MSKSNRLRQLECALAPRTVRPLRTIVEVVVANHTEYLDLQAIRATGRPIKLPQSAGPIVRLTAAEYRQLFAETELRKDRERRDRRSKQNTPQGANGV